MIDNTLRLSLAFSSPFPFLSDFFLFPEELDTFGLPLLWTFASWPVILCAVVGFTTFWTFLAYQ